MFYVHCETDNQHNYNYQIHKQSKIKSVWIFKNIGPVIVIQNFRDCLSTIAALNKRAYKNVMILCSFDTPDGLRKK
jgi:hypothetical protein